MKKVLILFKNESEIERVNQISSSLKKYLNEEIDLKIAIGYKECKIYTEDKNKIHFSINGYDLDEFNLVYMYGIGSINYDLSSLISQYCLYNGIKFINTREKYNYHVGKILQKLILGLNNLPTPRFFFSSNFTSNSYEEIKHLLGESFVLKKSKSRLGKKVFLIKSEKDFKEKLSDINNTLNKKHKLFFAEEYIPHKNTFRGIVCGDNCDTQIFVSKEIDSFKTNHGEAVFSKKVIPEIKDLSIKSANLLKLQIAGVDIVFDEIENIYKVFEINQSPGITIDKNLNSFEAEDIANYINSLL